MCSSKQKRNCKDLLVHVVEKFSHGDYLETLIIVPLKCEMCFLQVFVFPMMPQCVSTTALIYLGESVLVLILCMGGMHAWLMSL